MKNIYLIPVIVLRFQIGVITPKKTIIQEFRVDPAIVRLFIIPTRHRENNMVNKITKFKNIQNDNSYSKKIYEEIWIDGLNYNRIWLG